MPWFSDRAGSAGDSRITPPAVAHWTEGPMSAEQNKETVRRWIEEAWRTGNADLMDDLMDENMLDHNPIPGLPAGRAARKQILAMFHAAFDVQIKLDLLLADGD